MPERVLRCGTKRAHFILTFCLPNEWLQFGWAMTKLGSALLFFVLLVLGLSLMAPAEDLPETAYDESEPLPYESNPLISSLMPQAAASATAAERSAPLYQPAASFRITATRINGIAVHRPAEAGLALALLCTLLC